MATRFRSSQSIHAVWIVRVVPMAMQKPITVAQDADTPYTFIITNCVPSQRT